jgi:DsbC/DsbD-like thiol-disulfide interchange protein
MKSGFQIGMILVAVWGGMTQAAAAAAETPVPMRASFLADVKTVKPGQSFDVGLLLQLDAGWHVYWENPGEAGAPTRVRITAPAGVKVSDVRYPLPQEFNQAGDIKGYGYEGEVLLVARVTTPRDWPKGKPVVLSAQASWLSCSKEVCLQGKANLEVSVAVGDEPENANSELFAKWHPKLPMRVEDGTVPFMVVGPVEDLSVRWQTIVSDVKAYPVPPDGVEVIGLVVDHADRLTHIKPTLRLLGGEKREGAALGMLVTFTDDRGQRRGVRLSIPLRPRDSER